MLLLMLRVNWINWKCTTSYLKGLDKFLNILRVSVDQLIAPDAWLPIHTSTTMLKGVNVELEKMWKDSILKCINSSNI